MKKRFVVKASHYIKAAEDDEFMDDMNGEGISDAVDDVADTVEDIQDTIEDVREDDIDIEKNNNITNHYIAECERCQGIFISAVLFADQVIDHVSGICPLCNQETDQYLKWVIKDASEA